ncbi:MAG TPA: HD domain-containing phosphohydrolase [Thermoanaerobaculia bacterium]|nr:HD domain-containing phosphohydrolase [Thermoanaerobaculia bacterium]
MHPDVEELRPKLKEILYDCAVEIRATKAALYLYDGPGNRFELVTEYGFKVPIRQSADVKDPIVDRCGRGRTPFFVNGLAAEPRFSEIMYESQTERLLVAPIYMRGSLVGVVDMRDKAGKQPFELNDTQKAQKIADRIAELFGKKNVFGLRFIALSDAEGGAEITTSLADGMTSQQSRAVIGGEMKNLPQVMPQGGAPQPAAPAAPAAPKPKPPEPPQKPRANVGHLASLVLEARNAATRILVPAAPETLTENELAAVRELLKSTLLIPGAVAALFSAFGHAGGVQEVAARGQLADEGLHFLQSKLNVWLTKRGEAGGHVRTNMQAPLAGSTPVTVAQLQKVFTAPVNMPSIRGLYVTVAFEGNPDRSAHEMLAANLNQIQVAIEHALEHGKIAMLRTRVAEKLLEPDFTHYPELRRHTDSVAASVDQFLRFLAVPAHDAENARLLATVHDVGMRLLDYPRLYRKPNIQSEEIHVLREHVYVGAAVVEPLLGNEIARGVLCHHERVDGRGYPNELHGDEIPLIARIVQICDAWAAMTDPDTYQPVESTANALAIITRGAGSQFDAELASRFVQGVRSKVES